MFGKTMDDRMWNISLNFFKRCKIFAGRVDLQIKTDAVSFP